MVWAVPVTAAPTRARAAANSSLISRTPASHAFRKHLSQVACSQSQTSGTYPGGCGGLCDAAAEPVRFREALWREAPGVGAVALPVGQFLRRGAELAARPTLPAAA